MRNILNQILKMSGAATVLLCSFAFADPESYEQALQDPSIKAYALANLSPIAGLPPLSSDIYCVAKSLFDALSNPNVTTLSDLGNVPGQIVNWGDVLKAQEQIAQILWGTDQTEWQSWQDVAYARYESKHAAKEPGYESDFSALPDLLQVFELLGMVAELEFPPYIAWNSTDTIESYFAKNANVVLPAGQYREAFAALYLLNLFMSRLKLPAIYVNTKSPHLRPGQSGLASGVATE